MYHNRSAMSGPQYGFGTDGRFHRAARGLGDSAQTPGPGSYEDRGLLGEQRSSRLPSQPAFGFGSSNREQRARVYVSDLHCRASADVSCASPAPTSYRVNEAIGVQASTRGRSAPSWGFGRARRFKPDANETGSPGPGAYSI